METAPSLASALVLGLMSAAGIFGQSRPESGPATRPAPNAKPARPGATGRAPFTDETGHSMKSDPFVTDALDWLVRHQSKDGSFNPESFADRCDPKRGEDCAGAGVAGSYFFKPGVTGLALLALLHAGIDGTKKEPAHAAVKHGLAWLTSIQDREGCFGWRIDNRFTYGQAIATLVLCEALAATGDESYRKSAQAGLRFIAQCRNPGVAWRYGVKPGDSDSSVTGWMLRALAAGRDAGLQIDPAAMTDGLTYLDFLTNPETGRTGYIATGELPVRPEGLVKTFPAIYSESLTAMAVFCRILCLSDDAGQRRFLGPASGLIARNLPHWDPKGGSIDFYYWYYGTLASYQLGKDAWTQWDGALRKAATAGVRKTGCLKGSFDPIDAWGQEGSRIYSTALMALSLEVPYQSARRLK